MTQELKGSPCKLKAGDWGVRIPHQDGAERPKAGDQVLVETKSGKTWTKEVAAVVVEFDDATLVATQD